MSIFCYLIVVFFISCVLIYVYTDMYMYIYIYMDKFQFMPDFMIYICSYKFININIIMMMKKKQQ